MLSSRTQSFECSPEHPMPVIDYERLYEDLLSEVKAVGAVLGVPYPMYQATLQILDEVRNAYEGRQPWIACESMQGLSKALLVADTIEQFWGTKVDKPAVWCAFLLHDNGKIDLPEELNEKSHRGTEDWLEEDRQGMIPHVFYGADRVMGKGLPLIVERTIAESHGKQLAPPYGINPVLSPDELHVRNSVAIGDTDDAMNNRENSLNRRMSPADRMDYMKAYIKHVCGDYQNNGPALAELLIQRIVLQPHSTTF